MEIDYLIFSPSFQILCAHGSEKLIIEKYGTQQRIQVVKFYQNLGSIVQTQRAYCRHVQVRDAPSENAT